MDKKITTKSAAVIEIENMKAELQRIRASRDARHEKVVKFIEEEGKRINKMYPIKPSLFDGILLRD